MAGTRSDMRTRGPGDIRMSRRAVLQSGFRVRMPGPRVTLTPYRTRVAFGR